MTNNKKPSTNDYPQLGTPRQMFEGDNTYVVYERAELGKVYTFVCPHCHQAFLSSSNDMDVKKVKCPDCDTFICFSCSGGGNSESTKRVTRVQTPDQGAAKNPSGMLIWQTDDQQDVHYPLEPGVTTIGRQDEHEPSDISIADATASRRSVGIEVTKGVQTGNYSFRLTVMKTTNPVYVNQNMLYTYDSIYLNFGDTVRVGSTVFTLVANEDE